MAKPKTLGDYILFGKHEFIAHARNMMSLRDSSRSNHGTWGNDLGEILFGVLVCDRKVEAKRDKDQDRAQFFYKTSPIYDGDSDIAFKDFSYEGAKIINEVPLGIEVSSFWQGRNLKKSSEEFNEARELMQKYGIY